MVSYSLNTIHKIVHSIDKSPDLSHALNNLVSGIHKALGVDVCSIYLSDTITRTNILMATQGLNPDAVGKVVLPFEEGLVGLVTELSEPVNISNAPAHPRFKYVPEAGEDPFKSFLGVPVTRQGEQLAVLVVQQTTSRRFGEQEIAFLTTLAALLAGNIAIARARGLIDDYFSTETSGGGVFTGVAGAPGIIIGKGVVHYHNNQIAEVPDRPAASIPEEEERLRAAIEAVVSESKTVGEQLGGTLPATDQLVFNAYALIAGSDQLVNETIERIRAGNWAPGALRDTIESFAARFESLDEPYMRERANDIRSIGQRILGYLFTEEHKEYAYPEKTVLIGENLSPLDLGSVPLEKLAAIVSGHGSAYAHLAILAHALNIPAVLGLAGRVPLNRLDGMTLIVDGYKGQILVSPSQEELSEYQGLIQGEAQLARGMAALKDLPAVTTDGVRIHLYTNTGLLTGHSHAFDVGTEGIGLYRSEVPFMNRDSFPGEEEQRQIYRQVIEAYMPKPVTLRTLDVGGDKVLPYFHRKEPNPFLGWRGIRVVLDHPEMLLTQVRAMLRASEGYDKLKILLPMISNIDELERAMTLIRRAYDHVVSDGYTIRFPEIGAMIEVPSAVYLIDSITRRVDFLSIGTNDLIQYLLAIDRNNEHVAKLFDPLHPPVLEALRLIVDAAHRHAKPVSVCGEAAGDPALTILLIAMRVDSLSVSAGDLPRVKWVIRTLSWTRANELWQQARTMEHASEIRQLMEQELAQQGLSRLVGHGK
ncbi:MAG: phosphoenolpyruvate--protein phosphotransferase [Gammaproteobacteria bacterium RIFCSPLOWO2_02_FULL_56_15]|nr:MAG: phosphoenolpyruvate--protein phosphotransferase [Gammaproteobacteria bacterium RIFCSPLOWO2_02_FULL_56_15]